MKKTSGFHKVAMIISVVVLVLGGIAGIIAGLLMGVNGFLENNISVGFTRLLGAFVGYAMLIGGLQFGKKI